MKRLADHSMKTRSVSFAFVYLFAVGQAWRAVLLWRDGWKNRRKHGSCVSELLWRCYVGPGWDWSIRFHSLAATGRMPAEPHSGDHTGRFEPNMSSLAMINESGQPPNASSHGCQIDHIGVCIGSWAHFLLVVGILFLRYGFRNADILVRYLGVRSGISTTWRFGV